MGARTNASVEKDGVMKRNIKQRDSLTIFAILLLALLFVAGSGRPAVSGGTGTTYTVTDLPPLPTGCVYAEAYGVNDAGWVAGVGCDSQSFGAAVLWQVDATGKV